MVHIKLISAWMVLHWPNKLVKSIHVMKTCENRNQNQFFNWSIWRYHMIVWNFHKISLECTHTFTNMVEKHTYPHVKCFSYAWNYVCGRFGPKRPLKRGFRLRTEKKSSIIIKFDVVHDRNTNWTCFRSHFLFFSDLGSVLFSLFWFLHTDIPDIWFLNSLNLYNECGL